MQTNDVRWHFLSVYYWDVYKRRWIEYSRAEKTNDGYISLNGDRYFLKGIGRCTAIAGRYYADKTPR